MTSNTKTVFLVLAAVSAIIISGCALLSGGDTRPKKYDVEIRCSCPQIHSRVPEIMEASL